MAKQRFVLVRLDDGGYLHAAASQQRDLEGTSSLLQLSADDHACDAAMWLEVNGSKLLRHVSTSVEMTADALSAEAAQQLQLEESSLTLERGPECLPSVTLAQLRETGWAVCHELIDPMYIARLKTACESAARPGYTGPAIVEVRPEKLFLQNLLSQEAAVMKVSTNPIVLWLATQFLGTTNVKYAHSPHVTVLKPQDGRYGPGQNWHSDYPYHPGKAADYTHFPSEINLGLQFNTCIDSFTKQNGATMFVLDSARRTHAHLPPPAWNPEGGFPLTPSEAEQIEATAGSVLLYDARMWHRQHINKGQHDRRAMLNALTPGWIVPQFDQSTFFRQFLSTIAADERSAITQREMRDARQLMIHTTGAGQPLGALPAEGCAYDGENAVRKHADGHPEPTAAEACKPVSSKL